LSFAIGPDIGKKKISESDRIYRLANGPRAHITHGELVILVGARPGQRDRPQRQAGDLRLRFEDRSPGTVHRHAIKLRVNGGQQSYDFNVIFLFQLMKRPGTILATAPGQQYAFHEYIIVGS
jgi:hypothetical protein